MLIMLIELKARFSVSQGLFWALGCIWLIYRPIKMPHIKGESYTNFNSSYTYIYSDYLPVEFFCNGIISACLTFINVMCIFITAIIVLKVIKVSMQYSLLIATVQSQIAAVICSPYYYVTDTTYTWRR